MKRKKYRKDKKSKVSFLKIILKSKTKKLLIFCGLLVIIGLIGLGTYSWGKNRYEKYVKFFDELNPSFAPGDNVKEYVELDFSKSFNLLFIGLDRGNSGHIKSDSVILIHFDSAEQMFQLINLPTKAFYYVSKLKEYYQLDNVYAIGQLETPENGLSLVHETLEDSLALSIDGYFAMDIETLRIILLQLNNIVIQNEQDFIDNDLARIGLRDNFEQGKLKLNPEDTLSFLMADEGGFQLQTQRHYSVLNSLKSMLSRSLIFKLVENLKIKDGIFSNIDGTSIKRLMNFTLENKDHIKFYSPGTLTEIRVVKEKLVPIFSETKFDQRISEIFMNQDIKLEQARIEIYNGTQVNGLASKYSRYISNFGGDVTRVSSKSGEFNKTLVFTERHEDFEHTLRSLKLIFQDSEIISGSPDFSVTGDIIIIVGKDSET